MIKLAQLSIQEFLQAGLSFSDKFPSFWFFLNNSLDCKTSKLTLYSLTPALKSDVSLKFRLTLWMLVVHRFDSSQWR